MQAFIDLLRNKKLKLDKLISHIFEFKEAPKAYQMIVTKSEPFVGILLKYKTAHPIKTTVTLRAGTTPNSSPKVGFIGAGSFAQNFLLPTVSEQAEMVGVATARGNNARYIADKFNFQYCTGNADDIINDEGINTVFVATRHNLHAEYVLKALKAKKNVFVEKPLVLTQGQLDEVKKAYTAIPENQRPKLMVGFNRRFSPFVKTIKNTFKPELCPISMNYRINAGAIPSDHWVQDPEIGGGRIIGEVCHFVDLAKFLAGSEIQSVHATTMDIPQNLHDTLTINLLFKNGSIASISYFF